MAKYQPLKEYLESREIPVWHARFSDIDALIDGKLPKSAWEYRAWWANNPTGHSHSTAWVNAGWVTEDVDMSAGTLILRKVDTTKSKIHDRIQDSYGALAGTITILGDADITKPVDIKWSVAEGHLHE